MEVTTLKAEPRKETGSNQVTRLREVGRVPCVVYGQGGESLAISLSADDVERELRKHHRVFRLEHGGTTDGVFLQDVQFHVISDQPLHLDFRRIDLDKPIAVDIDLVFIGHPAGGSRGGVLSKDCPSFVVNSLPAAVPEKIEVPVKDVDLGDSVLAKDLELPAGVTLVEGTENTVICHMPAHAETEEEPAEEGEAAEPTEEPKE